MRVRHRGNGGDSSAPAAPDARRGFLLLYGERQMSDGGRPLPGDGCSSRGVAPWCLTTASPGSSMRRSTIVRLHPRLPVAAVGGGDEFHVRQHGFAKCHNVAACSHRSRPLRRKRPRAARPQRGPRPTASPVETVGCSGRQAVPAAPDAAAPRCAAAPVCPLARRRRARPSSTRELPTRSTLLCA